MPWSDVELAKVVADDIEDDWVINLGIGLPTTVIDHIYGRPILVHAENGIIGIGPPPAPGDEDIDVVNPGKEFATIVEGGAYMDSIMSFTLMRSGRIDLAVVGAYQVSTRGDLANWRLPGRKLAGIGGAADLAVGARQIWAMTKFHGPDDKPKLMPSCTYPLTARAVVSRVYTEVGVFSCGYDGARLLRAAPGVDAETLVANLQAAEADNKEGTA